MVYNPSVQRRPRGYSFYAAFASFSVACFILTFFTDLAYWATDSVLWETISVWLLAVGLIVGGVAVLAGIVDLVRSRNVAGLALPIVVVLGQVIAFGLSIINVFVHSRDGYTAVVPQGLVLSSLVVLVLLVTNIVGRASVARRRVGGLA